MTFSRFVNIYYQCHYTSIVKQWQFSTNFILDIDSFNIVSISISSSIFIATMRLSKWDNFTLTKSRIAIFSHFQEVNFWQCQKFWLDSQLKQQILSFSVSIPVAQIDLVNLKHENLKRFVSGNQWCSYNIDFHLCFITVLYKKGP